MPDHQFTRTAEAPRLLLLNLIVLILATISLPSGILAQSQPPGPASESKPAARPLDIPPVLPGSTYRALGRAQVLSADQYAVVPGGDVFVEYGLEKVTLQRYSNGRATMTVEFFEMRFPTGAYGLLTFNRNSLAINRREFSAGRYLVSVTSDNPATPVDPEGLRAVQQVFSAQGIPVAPEITPIVSHLPTDKRIEGSEKYIIGPRALATIAGFTAHSSSVDFTGGVEVAQADYQTGNGITRLVIIEYHTPQSATFGFEAATNRLNALPEEEKARRILKRVGNYVVEAKVEGDATAARAIVDQVKYEIRVYWEGKKFTSIPLQYRPPDPAAIEEITDTATVLLSTFYAIGAMIVGSILLGAFAGWGVFYWRKQKRRRLGKDDYFSDAGDTVRLNLDGYIFQPNEQPIKLLGKGDL